MADWVTVSELPLPTHSAYTGPDPTVGDFARAADPTFGLANRAAAGLSALTGGKGYDEALAEQVKRDEAAKARLGPLKTGVAEVVGGALPALASGGAGLSAAPLAAGRGLLAKTGLYGAEGAAYGAAQGAGHTYSGEPSDYARNAGMGALFGSGAGVAAPVAGALASGAYRAGAGMWGEIPDVLARGATADLAGLRNLANIPGAMLPDAGPSMRGAAQGVVVGPGGMGQTALINALTDRNAGSVPRITGELNRQIGPAGVPSEGQAAIADRMRAMSPEYQQVLLNSRAVDTQPIADWAEGAVNMERGPAQKAMREVRRMLDIADAPGVLDPHPEVLQKTRTAIRAMQDEATNADEKRMLGEAYAHVTQELHNKVPGIAALDNRYTELARQHDALGPRSLGSRIFDTARETVVRPAEFDAAMAQAAQPKGVNLGPSLEPLRLRDAARAELDRIVGTGADDLRKLENALATPADYNSQKLKSMFGEDKGQAISDLLTRERKFRDTYQQVVHGSKTAQTTASKEGFEAGQGKIPVGAGATGLLLRGAQEGLNMMRSGAAQSTRDRISQLMAERDPAAIQATANRWLDIGQARDKRAEMVRQLIRQGIIGGGVAPANSGGQ
jgi:hypothetical protein